MSSVRDYTDSEPESDGTVPRQERVAEESLKSEAGHLRITHQQNSCQLRHTPGNAEPGQLTVPTAGSHLASSDRSSLSPPPPIKLRLGLSKQSMSQKASYSSDSDQEMQPKKKAKPSSAKSTGKKVHPPPTVPGPSLPAQHRKTYDWLQPSSASASHTGPPERDKAKSTVWTEADEELLLAEAGAADTGEGKAKRRKRGSDAPVGPGKNWRKGIKKWATGLSVLTARGDPLPWKESTPLFSEGKLGQASPLGVHSGDVSPEPHSIYTNAEQLARAELLSTAPREPTPPFVPADAVKLGFPVFSKPIIAPKINLGPFPRVTTFFAPFDNKPFRMEKVRSWTRAERTVGGIGGSQLKVKTWSRGPQSELGIIVRAQKEADQMAAKARKAAADHAERPALVSNVSSESGVPTISGLQGQEEGDDAAASEVGDGDESVTGGVTRGSPRGRGGPSKRGRPRKSKLAQVIVPPEEPDSAEVSEIAAEA